MSLTKYLNTCNSILYKTAYITMVMYREILPIEVYLLAFSELNNSRLKRIFNNINILMYMAYTLQYIYILIAFKYFDGAKR